MIFKKTVFYSFYWGLKAFNHYFKTFINKLLTLGALIFVYSILKLNLPMYTKNIK